MAVFNLTYATTRIIINTLRKALADDPLFQPDGAGPSRAAETMVLDSWGYQVRNFPIAVVTGVPGRSRRMGIGDKVRPFFGVSLVEEPGGSDILRTFDVSAAVVIGSTLDIRYKGDNADDLNPIQPYKLEVNSKTVGPDIVKFVELTGSKIGPASEFPLKNFEASTKNYATGEVFGGWYDLNVEITTCARNTQTRELLADRLWSLMWFTKKKELQRQGVIVLDVDHSGFTQEPYGADQLYYSKFRVSIATEFEAIVQFVETVEEITVVGNAVST